MISKCANPDCEIHFDYRQGRFFRFPKRHTEGIGPTNAHAVEHFWLCERCSHIYTLEWRRGVGVVIRFHSGKLSKADRFRRIAAA
jgi:hypothetical protein